MKVLSPACFTQKPLFPQPPHAVRQKRILSERDKRAQLSWLVGFTTGSFSSPSTMGPLGEEPLPWETFPATAEFPFPAADHTCSASQPLPHICSSSRLGTAWRPLQGWSLESVQSIVLSCAHTLRRQQLGARLFLTVALRCPDSKLPLPLLPPQAPPGPQDFQVIKDPLLRRLRYFWVLLALPDIDLRMLSPAQCSVKIQCEIPFSVRFRAAQENKQWSSETTKSIIPTSTAAFYFLHFSGQPFSSGCSYPLILFLSSSSSIPCTSCTSRTLPEEPHCCQ